MQRDSQIHKEVMTKPKFDVRLQSSIGEMCGSGIIAKIRPRSSVASFTADTEVAKRVSGILKSNSTVNQENIRIKVEEGHVTLTGTVEKEFQRQSAKIVIQHLGGVRSVVNLISLNSGINSFDIV